MTDGGSVAIVLSDEFAGRLGQIAKTRPVWALRTPMMEAAVRPLWDARFHGDRSLETVTLFDGRETAESDLVYVIDEVELHHGAMGTGKPVRTLEVLGATPTDAVRRAFESDGFSRIEATPDGFVAYRDAAWVDVRQ